MADRYFAKVVKIVDKYTVVINAGTDKGVQVHKLFLIVGLGESIIDPDTNESLGQLEIVRGRAQVTHVQDRISTLRSADFDKPADTKEIKKVSTAARGGLATLFSPQETVTESIKPSEPVLKALTGAAVGDLAIEA